MNVFLILLILFLVNVKANDNELNTDFYIKSANYSFDTFDFKKVKANNNTKSISEIKIEKETDFYIKQGNNYHNTFIFKNVNLSELNLSEDEEYIGNKIFNKIDFSQLISDNITFKNHYLYDIDKKIIKLVNFNKILGREMKPDYIYINVNENETSTSNYIETQGGLNLNNMDLIQIENLNPLCKHLRFFLFPFTKLINRAEKGSFTYLLKNYFNYNDTSIIEIYIESNSTEAEHTFKVFNFIDNIKDLNLNNPSEITIEFKSNQKIKIFSESQEITLNFIDENESKFVKKNNYFVEEKN